MKHTPGPWHIDENAQIIAGKSVLGRVYSGDIFPNEDLEECTANGYLIARAPELLEENESLKAINKQLLGTIEGMIELKDKAQTTQDLFPLLQYIERSRSLLKYKPF